MTATPPESDPPPKSGAAWTFLTNHAHVLLCIAQTPTIRVREMAERVGITERAVLRILGDLETAGYLTKQREGRRNIYSISEHRPLRHPIESHRSVASLLALVLVAETAPREDDH
ncbi:MAG: winged helix-turn-helix domain-containing protein [Polyangiaceae bacterium]